VKRQATIITVLVVLATAGSVFLGVRAIVGTAAGLRTAPTTVEAAPGPIESTGNEVAALAVEISDQGGEQDASGSDRTDPMTPSAAAAPSGTKTGGSAPPRVTYTVTAVILDQEPTGILSSGGKSVVVHVGDQLGSGVVTAIEADGVTVTGEKGVVKYPFSSKK
jgi:hypothetical protein